MTTLTAKYLSPEQKEKATNSHLEQELELLRNKVRTQEVVIQDLKRQAMQDGLTGLANRRSFDKELSHSLAHFKRYNRHGALLLIDLDSFKSINDTLGHMAGDAILKHVASLLNHHTRSSDFIARMGGDEFCIILREISPREVMAKARQIARVIAASPCSYEGRDIRVTVSVGACAFHQATGLRDLLEKADKEMYRVKNEQTESLVRFA